MSNTSYYIPRYKPSPQLVDKLCGLLLSGLDGMEKTVMEMRMGFGLSHGMNGPEIGAVFKREKEWVGKMEDRALSRISLHIQRSKDLDRRPTYSISIKTLPLKTRTRRALLNNGIKHVEHLCRHTPGQLRALRGIGTRMIRELNRVLEDHDLALNQLDYLRSSYATI